MSTTHDEPTRDELAADPGLLEARGLQLLNEARIYLDGPPGIPLASFFPRLVAYLEAATKRLETAKGGR